MTHSIVTLQHFGIQLSMLRIPGAHQAYFRDFELSTPSKEKTSGTLASSNNRLSHDPIEFFEVLKSACCHPNSPAPNKQADILETCNILLPASRIRNAKEVPEIYPRDARIERLRNQAC
jgi:hypothetical protein